MSLILPLLYAEVLYRVLLNSIFSANGKVHRTPSVYRVWFQRVKTVPHCPELATQIETATKSSPYTIAQTAFLRIRAEDRCRTAKLAEKMLGPYVLLDRVKSQSESIDQPN